MDLRAREGADTPSVTRERAVSGRPLIVFCSICSDAAYAVETMRAQTHNLPAPLHMRAARPRAKALYTHANANVKWIPVYTRERRPSRVRYPQGVLRLHERVSTQVCVVCARLAMSI